MYSIQRLAQPAGSHFSLAVVIGIMDCLVLRCVWGVDCL